MRHGSNDAMVRALVRSGKVTSERVRQAFGAVDRAEFVPAGTSGAYRDAPVLLKVDSTGESVSTVSQPSMVALMLEQLAVRPGDRVLEVGTASGYNAALLAHLVGGGGLVVTIELDDELAKSASDRLATRSNIRVIVGDGRLGHADDAPYDGIIVTAGAAELHPAWIEQLRPGGRLVVPLTGVDRRGRCVTYERSGDRLVERASTPCGFVPLR